MVAPETGGTQMSQQDNERKPVTLHLTVEEREVLANIGFHDEQIGEIVQSSASYDRRSDRADVEHVLELVRRAVVRANTAEPVTHDAERYGGALAFEGDTRD